VNQFLREPLGIALAIAGIAVVLPFRRTFIVRHDTDICPLKQHHLQAVFVTMATHPVRVVRRW